MSAFNVTLNKELSHAPSSGSLSGMAFRADISCVFLDFNGRGEEKKKRRKKKDDSLRGKSMISEDS
jgi:hypothetical protein